jgi:hypothetical protein
MQVNAHSSSSQTAFTPSATDLVNAGQPTLTGRVETGYAPFSFGGGTSTANALNDGILGATTGNGTDLNTTAFDIDGTWTTTFNLNTTLNPQGYDISSIVTIAAWANNAGATRTDQRYSVQYTTVSNATPQTLGAGPFSYNPNDGGGNASSQITLRDSSGPGNTIDVLTGVNSLIFNFMPTNGVDVTQTTYREVDVFGQATVPVPEPSSCLFAAIGAIGLVLITRHKFQQLKTPNLANLFTSTY